MKIAVFAAVAAIIATQIGCTWWLSRQPMHLDPYSQEAISVINVTTHRMDCEITELKYMMYNQSQGQPLDGFIKNNGPCFAQ